VAISYTLQALRGTTVARYVGVLDGWTQISRVHSQWNRLAHVGAGGYIDGHPAKEGHVSITVYLPNSTSERLKSMMLPVLGKLARRTVSSNDTDEPKDPNEPKEPEIGTFSEIHSWDLYKEHAKPEFQTQRAVAIDQNTQEATGTGANKLIASWMWSAEDLANPRMSQALRGAYDRDTQMMTDATMGIGTMRPPYIRGGGNAVNPAMRTAVMRPAAEIHWEGTDMRKLETRTRDQLRLGASLRLLSPNGGTYPNEADPNLPNWQRAFWGSNYPKLLDIKQRVDPNGVFYCRSCVGSEYWDDVKGMLCRR
jgi:hypothetical protein